MRAAFGGIGALILAVGLCSVLPLFRDSPPVVQRSADDITARAAVVVPEGLTWSEALRDRNFLLMIAAFFIMAITVFWDCCAPGADDDGCRPRTGDGRNGGFDARDFSSGRRIWAGYLLDHYFAPYVAIAFFCGPIIGCLIFASGVGGWVTFAGAAAIGVGIGAEVDMIAYFLGRYLGLRAFGVLYGVLFGAYLVGGGVGPPLMGYGYDVLGSYANVLYGFAISTAFACVLLSRMGAYPTSFNSAGAYSSHDMKKHLRWLLREPSLPTCS